MYNLYHTVEFINGSKIKYQLYCPNYKGWRHEEHKTNTWIKIDDNMYACSECGCEMTMRANFKEEKCKD